MPDRDAMLEAIRKEIESELILWRDRRWSIGGAPHGLVVREKDGEPSPVIRMELRDVIKRSWNAAIAAAKLVCECVGEEYGDRGQTEQMHAALACELRVDALLNMVRCVVAAALPCADDDADAKDRLVLREALDELAKEGGSDA